MPTYNLDPITMAVLIGDICVTGILIWKYHRTRQKQSAIIAARIPLKDMGSDEVFLLTISKGEANTRILFPMIALLCYLVIYYIGGSASLYTNSGTLDTGYVFSFLIFFFVLVLIPLISTFTLLGVYYIVSNKGIEKHSGSKTDYIHWNEVIQLIQRPSNGDFKFLQLRVSDNHAGKNGFVIMSDLNNIDKFYRSAVEFLPEQVRGSYPYTRMEERLVKMKKMDQDEKQED